GLELPHGRQDAQHLSAYRIRETVPAQRCDSPSRADVGVPTAARRPGAGHLRSERGRQSVFLVGGRWSVEGRPYLHWTSLAGETNINAYLNPSEIHACPYLFCDH